MIVDLDKPGTPKELVLIHHGVKGMKWGVRNDQDTTGWTKRYLDAVGNLKKPTSHAEVVSNLKLNYGKYFQKFEVSGESKDEGHHLTPTQKKILIGAGVTAALLAAGGTAYYLHSRGVKIPTNVEGIKNLAGKKVSPQIYENMCHKSQLDFWGENNFLHSSSFERPEFELPVGHTFTRISSGVETTFSEHGTYAVHNDKDFNRYISRFTAPVPYQKIEFDATKPVKVPNLRTVLDTLKNETSGLKGAGRIVLSKDSSEEDVIRAYTSLSGSDWSSPMGKKLFSSLKGKGYSAIVDEMDAGVIGETPLVLFNNDNFSSKRSSLITPKIRKGAERNIYELAHRKI